MESSLQARLAQLSDPNIDDSMMVDRDESATVTGQYRGQAVAQILTGSGIIDDSFEELAQEAAENAEKQLEERILQQTIRGRGAPSSKSSSGKESSVAASTLADAVVDQMPDLGSAEKLLDLLSKLKEMSSEGGGYAQEELEQLLAEAYADVSQQYVALNFAEEALRREGSQEELQAFLGQARDALLEKQGPAVRAGLNVTAQAIAFANSGLAAINELRELYRKQVLHFSNVVDLYKSVMGEYGEENFGPALEFLLKALGNDLGAQGPSIDPAQLKAIMDDLYQAESLGNLHRSLSGLLEKTKKQFSLPGSPNTHQLMGKVLDFTKDAWIRGDAVTKMVTETRIIGVPAIIYFLTALKEQIRLIPLKIYPAPENRDKLLDATQDALDKAVERDSNGP